MRKLKQVVIRNEINEQSLRFPTRFILLHDETKITAPETLFPTIQHSPFRRKILCRNRPALHITSQEPSRISPIRACFPTTASISIHQLPQSPRNRTDAETDITNERHNT
eukprot:c15516_g1_i1 orf=208-537(-)